MSTLPNEFLVKITSAGTVSIPKQFRKHMDMQKGEYVKIALTEQGILIKKVMIT